MHVFKLFNLRFIHSYKSNSMNSFLLYTYNKIDQIAIYMKGNVKFFLNKNLSLDQFSKQRQLLIIIVPFHYIRHIY